MSLNFYWLLAGTRIALTCAPQLGYIHPDEYMQSVEVLAGKFFNVEHKLAWEFNATFPIRSMALPYFTMGMSFKFLQGLNLLTKEYFAFNLLTPYFVLLFPRLLMCALSFVVDFSIYKICATNNEKYKAKLTVLATSYVMVVYATRTFSNTLELVFFAILLYYVAESVIFSNILIKKKEYINYRYDSSKTAVDRAKFHKLKLYLTSDSLRNCCQISTIVVLGFFNRPTFLAFALAPVFFWLYRGIGSKTVLSLHFHLRILALIITSIPTICFMILVDSFYYGYITWGEIGMLEVSMNNFVFTPLHFLKYNTNSKNLAQHGLHPRYLNVLVNVPLLFNILGVITLFNFVEYGYRISQKKFNLLPTVRSIKGLMTLSIAAPVAILSMFPHQEPRFLTPIVVPIVYLHAEKIFREVESVVVKASTKVNSKAKTSSHSIKLKAWLGINVAFAVFYGFLHQGGVYPLMSYLENDMSKNPTTNYHVVTSYTYSLPVSLLLQKKAGVVYSSGGRKFTVTPRVFLHERGSQPLSQIIDNFKLIEWEGRRINGKLSKVLYAFPSSKSDDVDLLLENSSLKYRRVKFFYPHFSGEAVPNFGFYCLDLFDFWGCSRVLDIYSYFYKIFSLFGLEVIEFVP